MQKFSEETMADLLSKCREAGGPKEWILKTLGAPALSEYSDSVKSYAEYLWKEYPEKEDVFYQTSKTWAHTVEFTDNLDLATLSSENPVAVHPLALAFHKGTSLKPAPGIEKFMKLAGHYFKDGVVTASEPLLLKSIAPLLPALDVPWSGNLEAFSLGSVKGELRTVTAHAVLVWRWKNEVDLRNMHPRLWASLRHLFSHLGKPHTLLAEAMANMKISSRGDIRKANNVIECVFIMNELSTQGLEDKGAFTRTWNKQASKDYKILGKKAVALKLLCSLEQALLDQVLTHVGALGWIDCLWSEDNLAEKRMYPDYQFPGKNKKWAPRVKTSKDSMALMITREQTLHEKKPTFFAEKARGLCAG